MTTLREIAAKINDLDQRLSPIANRAVDITKAGWGVRLTQLPHPLDEAGARIEAESLLRELIDSYCTSKDGGREEIRNLFKEYRAFAWAAHLPFEPITPEQFRQHLVLFSMKDQGSDSRDALVWLQDLCRKAASSGLSTKPILKEVAELSSEENKYGMGSTKQMLLSRAS